MKRHWVSIVGLVSLVACSGGAPGAPGEAGESDEAASAADAIVGGHSDAGKDPAVVAIDIGGEGLCTGSLIGPRLVLTARHCVSETSEEVDCPTKSAQIQGERAADSFTILVGDDIRSARAVALGQRVITPNSKVLCEHDIALIELDRAVSGVTPLALASLSGVKSVRGVGFGKRGDSSDAGKKMTRSNVAVREASMSEFVVGVLSCNGDSGGPALDSKGRVVGVVSRGGPTCSGANSTNIYTRVDAFVSLIDQALADSGSGAVSGAGVSSGAQCGTGKRCANGTHCNASTQRCEAN